MATTNLNATLPVSEYDEQKVTPYNAALELLDGAIAGTHPVVTTGGTTTLAGTNASPQAMKLFLDVSGALTSNAIIQIPLSAGTGRNRFWIVKNGTTGAFTLTIKTVTGSGAGVTQGQTGILSHDGTNVIKLFESGVAGTGTVTSVAAGTGLTGGPITTSGTLSLANTAVTPGSYTNADITVDGQGRVTAAANGSGSLFTGCRVTNSAGISIPSGATTALTFNLERFDVGGLHDTAVNSSRITILTAGKYAFGGAVEWPANATGARQLFIQLSVGATRIAEVTAPGTSVVVQRQNVNAIWDCTAGQYFELMVFQSSGGALTIPVQNASSPDFWGYRIG